MSVATENFLKAIYHSKHRHLGDTKPGTIAKRLDISNAAATDMARKLAKKELIVYEKYKELVLTEKGERMALKVLRKHRLWEAFLFKLFDISLHEIHREAELLEHETSDFMADKIDEYLGHPLFDPHGDPIPDANGVIKTKDTSTVLSEAEEGKEYRISRLISMDKEFFDFCSENGLHNRAKVFIKKQYASTGMTQIVIDGQTLLLHKEFTKIIYVN
ncbi:MAG: metal-dependent transcriptional regulator [Cytophagales bacterium]|nr:metal-dependent transcriptional regulator [Cytophagales bacterium]